MNVIVEQRGEQVVRKRDGAEVAREMQIDALHRHDLRIAATCRAALHAKHGPEAWLAQTHNRLFASGLQHMVQCVAETHSRRLALARRSRTDGRHQNQLDAGTILDGDELGGHLGFGASIRLKMLIRNAHRASDGRIGLQRRTLRNIDV